MEFMFPGQKLILQGVDLALSPLETQNTFAYTLLFQKAEGIGLPQTNRFQNTIQGSGTFFIREKSTIEGRFVLTSNRLAYAGKEEYFEEIDLNFDGEIDGDKNEFSFSTFEIEIPSFVSLTGPLDIVSQDGMTLFFRSSLRIDDLGRILSLAKDRLPQQLEGLELSGSAFFDGEAHITPTHPAQKASITGLMVLNPSRIKYRTPEYQVDSHFSGSFKVDGFPDNQNISGRIKIVNSSFAGKTLEASGIKMDVPFVYNHKGSRVDIPSFISSATTLSLDIPNRTFKTDSPSFSGQGFIDLKGSRVDIPSFKAIAATLSLNIRNRTFKTDSPSFFGQGFIDFKKRSFQISRANIEFDPFPPFEVEAQASLGPQDLSSFSVSAQSSRIAFQTLMDFFSFAIPHKVKEWEPDGWLNIQIKANNSIREKQKVWDVSSKLEAFDVQFHDPSFAVAGESLQPSLTLEATFDHALDNIAFAAKMDLSQGESLYKDFYVNWSKMPILGTISGRFHVSQKKLTDLSIGATIPEFGRITANGRLGLQEPRSADLNVVASALQLASLYSFISQKRAVNQTQVKLKGEAESQFDAKIDKNAFSIVGYLKVKDASWSDDDTNLAVQGIEAYIPLHYVQNTRNTKNETAPQEKGYLTFQKFHSSNLDLLPLKLDISSIRNGYSIQPFELDIFGIKADVGETLVEYGFNPSNFRALTSFSWKEGDLSQLPLSSRDFRLKGILSVDLPQVEISPDLITTEGQGEADAFGGKIDIENIQVNQPFAKNRTISCDVKLSGLDLEKITDSIPFGRVTGIINGEIQDLALSYGQPERFNIHIESEKRKGVLQRFSLKATNDLAILGTGEKTPFSPQSGWTRLVKNFRYGKIGIACSLKNDMFTLRGTIQGKGDEYLVKGSGLFAINVVNKQTRNQIQFKDMLSRIKRIGESKQSP